MLSGNGVVAIWNGIANEGRLDFYQWHIHEHMPERTDIPGFLRGRRYRAADANTHPEFFTLYEVEQFEVLTGPEYAKRLNAPTPWTRRATSHFLNTSRGLARVLYSGGPGPGGALATVRFELSADAPDNPEGELTELLTGLAQAPFLTGAHLCRADGEATQVKTAETRKESDYDAPPVWIIILEGCNAEALWSPMQTILQHPYVSRPRAGRYQLEYTRLKTEMAAG
ncbi:MULTISPECIES: hypothetical protein [Mesorhizobium]|uniref:hypothetical protein n=1 Tax=Mesorhizobium TaxID=68287 RepID=UPI0003CED917|nr:MULTISPECIES: hypothetical protein [Mesorhizobium]ESY65875.1 hypothetical protein X742_20230 [Mesorhizobium sp. LNHC232B00]WJI38347.1 hypothetical protein NL534_31690 [Mesorhizobium opportunistum]